MANENVITRKVTKIILRDDKEYSIEPLTINELIKVWPIIQKLEGAKDSMDEKLLKSMLDIAYVALKKQVPMEKIGDLVDLVDLKTIISAIVGNVA